MTKGDLIKALQEDSSSLDTNVNVYLQCTNEDKGVYGEISELRYDKRFGEINILGEYEEFDC